MIDKGQWREFGQDTAGVTPLLFTRSAMGVLMTTESQDLGLTSHSKDGAFCAHYTGALGPTDRRKEGKIGDPCSEVPI